MANENQSRWHPLLNTYHILYQKSRSVSVHPWTAVRVPLSFRTRDHDGSYTVEGRCSPLEGLQTGGPSSHCGQSLLLKITNWGWVKLGTWCTSPQVSIFSFTSSTLCCKKQPPIGKPGGFSGAYLTKELLVDLYPLIPRPCVVLCDLDHSSQMNIQKKSPSAHNPCFDEPVNHWTSVTKASEHHFCKVSQRSAPILREAEQKQPSSRSRSRTAEWISTLSKTPRLILFFLFTFHHVKTNSAD